MILIPAAGDSRRMRGTDKLTQDVGGEALLRHIASAALATGQQVVVTLPPLRHPFHEGRLAALAGLPVVVEQVDDAAEGLSASLRKGMLPIGTTETQGVMVLLADLPEITAADLGTLIADFLTTPDRVLRATSTDGTPGHPVILPRRVFPQLAQLSGDAGARDILREEAKARRMRFRALPGQRATTDLDTPEAWEAWRAAQN
ncbi:nucleotidyltransferase family protein [Acidimangrovimonas sediminis]|uniref:nucleotidyltransferase family protein n=1 Tax=Acidimangrovimonas sediminis TaxID=2056283 RepID=UPI001E593E3A|nr:nucleotidyltransferase family protein [Acidimangrovimonas sediminis]